MSLRKHFRGTKQSSGKMNPALDIAEVLGICFLMDWDPGFCDAGESFSAYRGLKGDGLEGDMGC